jgi:iron(III) transport system ATP-binding protein
MIELNRISKSYGSLKVIEDISLKIADSERLVILGPSGCGKTTLLRLIAGFQAPDTGTIIIDGKIVSNPRENIPPYERNIGMVFQSLALWPHLTVFENIDFCLRPKINSKRERARKIKMVLGQVNLNAYTNLYPHKLSGGERQRVALARAIAPEPKILLLDEPLANLDIMLKGELQNMILELQRSLRFSLIYVTHDQDEAWKMAERIGLIYKGRIEQVGTPNNLIHSPETEFVRVFLKNKFKGC